MRVPGELLQMCVQKGLSVEGTVWGLNDNEKPRGRVPDGSANTWPEMAWRVQRLPGNQGWAGG